MLPLNYSPEMVLMLRINENKLSRFFLFTMKTKSTFSNNSQVSLKAPPKGFTKEIRKGMQLPSKIGRRKNLGLKFQLPVGFERKHALHADCHTVMESPKLLCPLCPNITYLRRMAFTKGEFISFCFKFCLGI